MGKGEPKVSVIIPCYNVEKYVKECVDSVLNQTLKDIEIIIINDGSTDGTRQVLKEYEGIHNVHVIDQENKGLSASRNKGLEMASGKYVYFLDSDDFIQSDMLERACQQMDDQCLEQLIINAKEFEDDNPLEIVFEQNPSRYSGIHSGRELFCFFVGKNEYSPCAQYRVLNRSFIEKNHINFYEGIIHEDELFTFTIMMISERSCFNNELIYFRRRREGSITNKVNHYKRWVGLSTCLHVIYEQGYWKNADEYQIKYVNNSLALRFDMANVSYNWLEHPLRKLEKSNYEQMLVDAKHFNYFDSKRIRIICKFNKIYLIYRLFLKIIRKLFIGYRRNK